ncbi:ribonuclease H family protein [Thermaerobacillus caldiproteolyticus]|uniref:Ribonuclease HI n=1 Tax=Thermaerobacillus caldiproteolyticus TaxID=247480 RepID=A0A7V9Z9B8_9BACL|nr:ribonuclease H family protein [Anoxybacillus caldiproteolyticus]MBA2876412.1 ribonuclease HI [Anoxybacillus caldiproteolyticus]QPA32191.1 reverse transcriptase-like protein [Anoxybacillus caldiproteolyticus]
MDVMIRWVYVTPKKQEVVLTSDLLPVEQALLLAEDFEKTGRVKELTFIDRQHVTWTKKELIKLQKELETEPHDVIAYFDGSFDNETLQSGVGVVIYYKQNNDQYRFRANRQLDELKSNNEAEYAAFWFLVQMLEELGVHHLPVVFRGDSHVVLNQLSGMWPCFEDDYNAWLDRIEAKLAELGIQPVYEPISRKQNKEADQLARQALEGKSIASTMELGKKE